MKKLKQQHLITNRFTYFSIIFILAILLSNTLLAQDSDEVLRQNHQQNEELLDSLGSGTLLLRNARGERYISSVLQRTQADVDISGPIAKTVLTQEFFNNGSDFAEGVYAFPLPDNAAVGYMEVEIGTRRIVGKIMEKKQAKRVYEKAKRQGKRAALVEQQRPNLFKSSIANIPAGESIKVTLHLHQTLDVNLDADSKAQTLSYRLPLTFTERFNPAPNPEMDAPDLNQPINTVNVRQNNISNNHSSKTTIRNPLNISIRMHQLGNKSKQSLRSLYHKTDNLSNKTLTQVNFSKHDVAMDRDFVLEWNINPDKSVQPVFFTETIDGTEYGLMVVNPPSMPISNEQKRREVIYIIDSSGSMGGTSMRQAKQSLLFALENLSPDDRFNIIDFDSTHNVLFKEPEIAAPTVLDEARRFINNLEAGGGTNMAPALESALNMKSETGYLKQVIFITDGAVSNEQHLFTLLHQNLGKARLFTVGIGSAPNSYFMRKAAEFGRGTFTHIGSLNEVTPRMSELFTKIQSPVLQDLKLDFPNNTVDEQWPATIPDLYTGEPLIVSFRFNSRPNSVRLSGKSDSLWQQDIYINQTDEHPGVAKLWARQKIQALMDKRVRGSSEAEIKPQVIDVALTHSILSQYTSFVAVDETPARHQDQKLAKGVVPNLTPKGHRYPSGALGLKQLYLLGWIGLLLFVTTELRYRSTNAKQRVRA